MIGKEVSYQYDDNYPYLKTMVSRSGTIPYKLGIGIRAFSEVYFPLRLRPGQSLLDIGCGTGNLGNTLRFGGVHTDGIDINFSALKAGRDIWGINTQHRVAQANAVVLPFVDNSFDSVVSQDLLEHLPSIDDADRAFREMERVCKGDRMLHKVTVLEDKSWIHADKSHKLKWYANEWTEFFKQRGWRVVAPTTRRVPLWNGKRISIGQMHGYFLLER